MAPGPQKKPSILALLIGKTTFEKLYHNYYWLIQFILFTFLPPTQ